MAGWNGSSGGSSAKPKKPVEKKRNLAVGKGALAGVIVVIAAALAFYFIFDSSAPATSREDPIKKSSAIADAYKPDDVTKVRPTKETRVVSSTIGKGEAAEDAEARESAEAAARAEALEEERRRIRKRTFKEGTDQLIYLAVFASNGAMIPPLPHMTETETDKFIASLRKPIDIPEDDPEQLKAIKRQVNEVRQQIAGLMAQNPEKELSEILNEHRKTFNDNLNLKAEAEKSYTALLEEGDAEGAEAYRQKANELLESYGAEPIESAQESDDEGEAQEI